jgi:ubiquinone/menaquinone biosynthesis C-methylase UbiE
MNDSNISTFSTGSDNYLKYRPKYPKELYDYIVHQCILHDSVWDCACGNGQVAADISDYFSNVEASDIAESQIENAIKIDNVHYTVQDSENTTFPDNAFDAICIAQALHWFPTEKFFREVKRVLKPSGKFFCWGYSFFMVEKAIDTLIQENLLSFIDPFWADGNRVLHHEYDQVHFPFSYKNKTNYTMIESWNLELLCGYIATWSAVKLYNEHHSTSIVKNLFDVLVKYWGKDEFKSVSMECFCVTCSNSVLI